MRTLSPGVLHPREDIPVDAPELRTVRDAARVFFSRPGPRLLLRHAAAAWTVRALLGPPRPSDAVIVASTVAAWPFQERLFHKYLLHLRPGRFFGKDPTFARAHRAHHADPRDVDTLLIPPIGMRVAMGWSLKLWLLMGGFRPTRIATGHACYATLGLGYEWMHFLSHTRVPAGRYVAGVRRHHLLHHYRSEDHWYAFMAPAADVLAGSAPDPATVPRSPTCRDLFGLRAAEDAAAAAEAVRVAPEETAELQDQVADALQAAFVDAAE